MLRLLTVFCGLLLTAASVLAIDGASTMKSEPTTALGQGERVWQVAQGDPPWPGCKRECTPMKKCTPGPCKRVGDTMVCEKERCETVQSCGWVCPQKK